MRKLSRLLHRYRVGVENFSDKNNWDEAKKGASVDVLGGLKSQDVELLLDLLAETNGVEVALRILTLLDNDFHEAWKVHAVKQVCSILYILIMTYHNFIIYYFILFDNENILHLGF